MSGVRVSNRWIIDEKAITPADDTQIEKPYDNGFRVGGAGNVVFSYKASPTVKYTRAFSAGDIWYGDIFTIDATSTTATSITGIRLEF